MADQMWRFPDNNYTSENGLDTATIRHLLCDYDIILQNICQTFLKYFHNIFCIFLKQWDSSSNATFLVLRSNLRNSLPFLRYPWYSMFLSTQAKKKR